MIGSKSKNTYGYKITNLIGNRIFDNFDADAIIYPSINSNYGGPSIAIKPDIVDNNFVPYKVEVDKYYYPMLINKSSKSFIKSITVLNSKTFLKDFIQYTKLCEYFE